MPATKINASLYWEDHQGEMILHNDLKDISIDEFVKRMDLFERYVLDSGKTNIKVYSDITNTNFDAHSISELKKIASSTKTVISKYAVIGVAGIQKILFYAVKQLATNELHHFDSVQDAKQWLVK